MIVDRQELIGAVEERLSRIGHGFTFEVVEGGVRKDEAWWYIPILATGRDGRAPTHEFLVTTYTNIEDDIEQDLGVHLLLIPAA